MPMTQSALIWMVDTTVDALVVTTVLAIVSMTAKSSTVARSGCWRMTGVPSVRAR